jgi:16S rRNA (guanine(966)-N(2))-methyltransferase RsmD
LPSRRAHGYDRAVRVIAGSLGGRRLVAPGGALTRPTADRVREAVFSILGPPAEGCRVLDLFAGAGGLGIEALSRGAAHAVFVDRARPAVACLRRNLEALEIAARARIVAGDVERALADLDRRCRVGEPGFDWVFIDPPYAGDLAARTLEGLGAAPALLRADATLIAEHDRRRPLDPAYGALERADQRRYGDTAVSIYRSRAP